jgi:hypothetical protein
MRKQPGPPRSSSGRHGRGPATILASRGRRFATVWNATSGTVETSRSDQRRGRGRVGGSVSVVQPPTTRPRKRLPPFDRPSGRPHRGHAAGGLAGARSCRPGDPPCPRPPLPVPRRLPRATRPPASPRYRAPSASSAILDQSRSEPIVTRRSPPRLPPFHPEARPVPVEQRRGDSLERGERAHDRRDVDAPAAAGGGAEGLADDGGRRGCGGRGGSFTCAAAEFRGAELRPSFPRAQPQR